jgi:hypothetical protein
MSFFARLRQMGLAPWRAARIPMRRTACAGHVRRRAAIRDANMKEHALMKYGISSLLGPGLAGALLLGSGCIGLLEGTTDEGSGGAVKEGPPGFPRIAAKLSHGNGTCLLPAGQTDVPCDAPVRAGEVMQASVDVEWGELSEGVIVMSPTCSSTFVEPVDDGSAYQEAWRAPLSSNMACEVTFEASSLEGPFATAKMYYSVVDGQPPGEVYGAVNLEHTSGHCALLTGDFSEDCEPVRAGEIALVYVDIDWGNDEVGSIAVGDNCGGAFTTTFSNDVGSQTLEWKVPSAPTSCTLALEAITAGGERHLFELNVPIH